MITATAPSVGYVSVAVSYTHLRGYVPADENREYCTDVNVIPIDSIYTPIRNVTYQIEPFRVEQKTDYDNLVLEITTDGSIHPKEELKEAAKILIYHFMLFSDAVSYTHLVYSLFDDYYFISSGSFLFAQS